uniref:Uncharacterized protein n=1 Tax=Medicago truncatula TaxID=3880 RepID=I3T9T6_MEDTR|nr:unknown [Medicago truncatula]
MIVVQSPACIPVTFPREILR